MTPTATIPNQQITVLVQRTVTFSNHQTGQHFTLSQKSGPQTAPSWILDTETFQACAKNGEVVQINKVDAVAVVPPTLDAVMARGYSKEEAEKIVATEQAKCDAGEYPYPKKEVEEPIAPAAASTPVSSKKSSK